jgi:hypothetical protein
MMTPPPVSGISYPSVGLSQERSNYLSGGVSFEGGYVDNVFAGQFAHPVAAEIYSVLPFIAVQEKKPRQSGQLSYTAGFTFYEPVSQLNEIDQGATGSYEYRISPRVSVSAEDTFVQTSNAFASSALDGSGVIGSGGVYNLITPFGDRRTNDGGGGITYQFGLNGMVGGSAESDVLDYPDLPQVSGLANSNVISGTGFYDRRLSPTRYVGAVIAYTHITTSPIDTTLDAYSSSLFYTLYIRRNVSLSVEAGAEYYETTQAGLPKDHAWTPTVTASGGWQGGRSAISGRYSRMVTGGGGLVGSYTLTSANATYSWQASKVWAIQASSAYAATADQGRALYPQGDAGHSVTGAASVSRLFKERLECQLGYRLIHERYDGISALAGDPNSNEGFISISYHFQKPIGQ